MKRHYDAVVIGGGIIGSAIAYQLAKEKKNTALLESGTIGGRTTSAAAGMLGAHAECEERDAFFDFAMHSQRLYQGLGEELFALSGIDIRRHDGGMFKLAFSEEDVSRLRRMDDLDSVSWHTKEEVLEKEPYTAGEIYGASFIQDDVHVDPYFVGKAYAKSAKALGTEIFEHTPVLDVTRGGESILVKTASGDVHADHVVVASGVWSGMFFKQLGLNQSFFPVKGECLSVWNDDIPLTKTLYHDHCYIVPRKSGRLVVGATMKPGDWSDKPDLGGLQSVMEKAKTMLPAIQNMKVDRFWAGLRPGTKDGKPYIGRHPEDSRILFAAGHFRNGILLAPATGAFIGDLMMNKEVKADWLHAFRIDRKEAVQI
ncbi:glycine oxidase ThiO [Bacillus halotolerans]|uniref:glycine oxidase ThiO n=1 Tax=Bacillus halotolerans TaxID=260554 RepID=UPI001C3E10FC|nr:glycine oxidase ThiO [Bacillus halotolerans]MBV5120955.1 glycine oxidase ThiO [Bacillus halotolerans]MCC2114384.1 glycine oxidase ThiO [Bacillus halotolerans]